MNIVGVFWWYKLTQSVLCAKTITGALLIKRLTARRGPPSDRTSRGVPTTSGAWWQGVLRQAIDPKTMVLTGAWRLAMRMSRQAVCTIISPGSA